MLCVSKKISNQWSYKDKQERDLLHLQSRSGVCDSSLICHPSPRPCPSSQSPLPFDSGLSPVTRFGQWDGRSRDVTRGLKCAWLAVLAEAGLHVCFPAILRPSYLGQKGDIWNQVGRLSRMAPVEPRMRVLAIELWRDSLHSIAVDIANQYRRRVFF